MSEQRAGDGQADGELSAWQREWQELGSGDDRAAALVARASRDEARMKRAAAGEIAAVIFSSSLCVYLDIRTNAAVPVVVLTALVLLFNGAWLMQYFSVRQDLFASSAEGVDAYIDLTRRRLSAELRWMGYARRWTIGLCVLLAPMLAWFVAYRFDAYAKEPWRAIVGIGGAVCILTGLFVWMRVKTRRLEAERARFEREV